MEELVFMVKGSSPEPYKVTFTKNKNNINAFCTCLAGENGQYCKHRFAIMAGDGKAVVSSNKDKVVIVKSWLPGSDLEEALMELAEAEHEHEKAKKRLTAAKKNVARALHRTGYGETMANEKRLQEAIDDGEELKVIYQGGSQPGSLREIAPISLKNGKVSARCFTSNAVKSFLLEKISIVDA